MKRKIKFLLLGSLVLSGCNFNPQAIFNNVSNFFANVFASKKGEQTCHHNIVVDPAVEATCSSTGLTEGKHCDICGEVIIVQEVIEKKEHTIVVDPAIEPTYTESGLSEGSHCSVCGEVIVAQTEIPAQTQGHVIFEVEGVGGKIIGKTDQIFNVGDSTEPVKAIADIGYKFKEWSNGSTDRTFSYVPTKDETIKAYFEVDTDPLPTISINTTDGAPVDSKEVWVTCEISTKSQTEKYCYENLTGKIKGRGNSTWGMPKKPFKFKLDSKTDLFGFGKAKNWVLLANYDDPSSLRNQIAYTSGKCLDDISEFTPDTMQVEVLLNGEYLGVYNFTEQIEINKNRVDITKDSPEADTGFVIEQDWRAPDEGVENTDYFVVNGVAYAVKDPDPDDELTSEQMAFIKNYFTQCVNALSGNDYDSINNLIDVNTFAATYIIQEMCKSVDIGGLSFYFYKDAGGKLCSGPIWDFDITQGNCDYGPTSILTDYLYAREVNFYYNNLCKFADFRDLVASKLSDKYEAISENIDYQIEFAKSHADSFYRNFDKWQTIGIYVWPNPAELVAIKTWEGHLDYLQNWTQSSLSYLKGYYSLNE